MPELGFPFLAMGWYRIFKMHISKHMCQLMQQGNQEAEFVQVQVHAYPVVRIFFGRDPVI